MIKNAHISGYSIVPASRSNRLLLDFFFLNEPHKIVRVSIDIAKKKKTTILEDHMQEKNHPVRLGRQHRELQTSLYFMVITNMLLGLTVVILSRKREITQFC